MARVYLRGDLYWADYRDAHMGKRTRRPTGCSNKTAAQALLAQWIKEGEMAKAGLLPVKPEHMRAPLIGHIDDWIASVRAAGAGDEPGDYSSKVRRDLLKAADDMGWSVLSDMTGESIHAWLLKQSKDHSVHTTNNRRGYINAFLRWCVIHKRIVENPLRTQVFRGDDDRKRRALTIEEIHKLLSCTQIPEWRRVLYRVAIGTGLRASELWGLQVQHVRVDTRHAHLYLPAWLTKSGKCETVPLSSEMSGLLAWAVRGKPIDARVFGALCAEDFENRRFTRDLEVAGIQIEDHRGHVACFHGLRKTFNTLLAAQGVSGTIRQRLMRQRSVELADVTYLDDDSLPLDASIQRMPSLIPGMSVSSGVTNRDGTLGTGTNASVPSGSRMRPRGVEDPCNMGESPEHAGDIHDSVPEDVPLVFSDSPENHAEILNLLRSECAAVYMRGGSFCVFHIPPSNLGAVSAPTEPPSRAAPNTADGGRVAIDQGEHL